MTTQEKRVLLVDDEQKLVKSIAHHMKMLGFDPHTATSGLAAIEIAKENPIDLAIVDLQMPDMDGLVVITKLKEIDPKLRTVLLTGHGNEKVRQATESLNTLYFEKEEMDDFWRFVKKLNVEGHTLAIHPASAPAKDGSERLTVSPAQKISGAQDGRDVVNTANIGTAGTAVASRPEDIIRMQIIGETSAMQKLRKNLARAASLDYTIALKGEPGTGKELSARSIHAVSQRHHKRFLAIDSNNFSNAQLAGQLLGFKASNLSDAIITRSGVFGPDPVGTLLLTQVETMPSHIQDQLLKTFEIADRNKFGGQKGSGLDIQIIVATQTDLSAQVRTGAFNKDLHDRLNAFELTIPPLRERKEDIHPLCWYFFDKYRKELDKPVESISTEVIETLVDYLFPGNVSELENIIERAVIIADGKMVSRRHLPARLVEEKKPERPVNLSEFSTLAVMEKHYIVKVLEATGGNKTKTAEILGISRGALWRKIKQLKTEKTGQGTCYFCP